MLAAAAWKTQNNLSTQCWFLNHPRTSECTHIITFEFKTFAASSLGIFWFLLIQMIASKLCHTRFWFNLKSSSNLRYTKHRPSCPSCHRNISWIHPFIRYWLHSLLSHKTISLSTEAKLYTERRAKNATAMRLDLILHIKLCIDEWSRKLGWIKNFTGGEPRTIRQSPW